MSDYLISVMVAGIWAIALVLLIVIWQLHDLEKQYALLLSEILALKDNSKNR